MSLADRLRAKAHAALERVPGDVGDKLARERSARPPARRRSRARGSPRVRRRGEEAGCGSHAPARREGRTEQAPVIVYYMEKQKRDVSKLTDILDANGVTYTVTNIQEDPAAQYAVRRDSNGVRLPVVFIAGDCIGGREALVNASSIGRAEEEGLRLTHISHWDFSQGTANPSTGILQWEAAQIPVSHRPSQAGMVHATEPAYAPTQPCHVWELQSRH